MKDRQRSAQRSSVFIVLSFVVNDRHGSLCGGLSSLSPVAATSVRCSSGFAKELRPPVCHGATSHPAAQKPSATFPAVHLFFPAVQKIQQVGGEPALNKTVNPILTSFRRLPTIECRIGSELSYNNQWYCFLSLRCNQPEQIYSRSCYNITKSVGVLSCRKPLVAECCYLPSL